MFDKMRMLFWQFFIVVVILFAHGNVMAEEVGKTPEGNVIYRFRCPGGIGITAKWSVNWPNHISDHPEFDIEGIGSSEGGLPARGTIYGGIKRSGQVIRCNYSIDIERVMHLLISYKYKVKRDIISCKNLPDAGLECILKPAVGWAATRQETVAPVPVLQPVAD